MPVRAYRVNKIDLNRPPSWNFWNSEALVEFLERNNCLDGLEDSYSGMIVVAVDVLKKILDDVTVEPSVKQSIEADIKFAEAEDNDCVTYYCF